jgi:hypothetical protein
MPQSTDRNWQSGSEKLMLVFANDRDPNTITTLISAKDHNGNDCTIKLEKSHKEFVQKLLQDSDAKVLVNTVPFRIQHRRPEEREEAYAQTA